MDIFTLYYVEVYYFHHSLWRYARSVDVSSNTR